MNSQIKTPQAFQLSRYPKTRDPNLRAWNAADEYLIQEISSEISPEQLTNPLIVNDQFGALSLGLNAYSPKYWTDSFLSEQAINQNAQQNLGHLLTENKLEFDINRNALKQAVDNNIISEKFSLVVMKVPKHLSLLNYQLSVIRKYIQPGTLVIAAGMTKEIHNSTLNAFEKWIGTTKTSLARKKARLIFSSADSELLRSEGCPEHLNPTREKHYLIDNVIAPEKELTICGLPGVFSRDNLDMGTRILLQSLPTLKSTSKTIDLGCGAGVIGATLAQAYPEMKLTLTDESNLAVESSRLTFKQNNLSSGRFKQTDVLDGIKAKTFDYVICNPPFHQQNTQSLSTANKMFRQSARALMDTGEMYLVANRHLKYGKQLNKYFNSVSKISEDKKFIIWKAAEPIK